MLRTDDPARGEKAYELAAVFCEQARLRVDHLFEQLWSNTDDSDRRLANEVLNGAYTWLEDGIVDPSEGTGPWIAPWQPGESTADNVSRRYR
jgi:hypothetical protein